MMDLGLSELPAQVQSLTRRLAQSEVAPLARRMDDESALPLSLGRRTADLGLLGAPIRREYGRPRSDAQSPAGLRSRHDRRPAGSRPGANLTPAPIENTILAGSVKVTLPIHGSRATA